MLIRTAGPKASRIALWQAVMVAPVANKKGFIRSDV